MAERRMFAKTIIDSDAFLDMSLSTQALYFHLNMRADDDGFINNPKKIQRMIGCGDDELKLLIAKRFIIPFESGICVIKHWLIHNYIRNDRYTETIYKDEKSQLETKTSKAYTMNNSLGIPNSNQEVVQGCPQVRLGKDRLELGKDSIDKKAKPTKIKYADRVALTEEEYKKLIEQYSETVIKEKIIDLDLWKGSKGKNTKSDYLTLLAWLRKDSKGGTNGGTRQNNGTDSSKDYDFSAITG